MMRCARFGLFLYLFTVPWTLVFFSWSGHDYARILQVGVAGLAGLALLWEGWRGWSPRLPRWGLALLVTGLLAAGLSIAQAPEPVWAWREAACSPAWCASPRSSAWMIASTRRVSCKQRLWPLPPMSASSSWSSTWD
jgi:hypothetical protein